MTGGGRGRGRGGGSSSSQDGRHEEEAHGNGDVNPPENAQVRGNAQAERFSLKNISPPPH